MALLAGLALSTSAVEDDAEKKKTAKEVPSAAEEPNKRLIFVMKMDSETDAEFDELTKEIKKTAETSSKVKRSVDVRKIEDDVESEEDELFDTSTPRGSRWPGGVRLTQSQMRGLWRLRHLMEEIEEEDEPEYPARDASSMLRGMMRQCHPAFGCWSAPRRRMSSRNRWEARRTPWMMRHRWDDVDEE